MSYHQSKEYVAWIPLERGGQHSEYYHLSLEASFLFLNQVHQYLALLCLFIGSSTYLYRSVMQHLRYFHNCQIFIHLLQETDYLLRISTILIETFIFLFQTKIKFWVKAYKICPMKYLFTDETVYK